MTEKEERQQALAILRDAGVTIEVGLSCKCIAACCRTHVAMERCDKHTDMEVDEHLFNSQSSGFMPLCMECAGNRYRREPRTITVRKNGVTNRLVIR